MPTGWITKDNYTEGVRKLSPANNFNRKAILNIIHSKRQESKSSDSMKSYLKRAAKQVAKIEYLLFLFWSMFSYTGHIGFVSTFNEYAMATTTDEATGRGYIDFYGDILFSSAFVVIITAVLIDFNARKYTDQAASFHFKVVAFGVLSLFSVLISCARYVMQWTLDERFVKINVITFLVSLPFLTGQATIYVRCNFPIEFFGLLSGLVRTMMSTSICL